MKYEVYFKRIKIGLLEYNKSKGYRYTPDKKEIEKIKDVVSLSNKMANGTEWGEDIPFLENRINNAKRFSIDGIISSHTDEFVIVKK